MDGGRGANGRSYGRACQRLSVSSSSWPWRFCAERSDAIPLCDRLRAVLCRGAPRRVGPPCADYTRHPHIVPLCRYTAFARQRARPPTQPATHVPTASSRSPRPVTQLPPGPGSIAVALWTAVAPPATVRGGTSRPAARPAPCPACPAADGPDARIVWRADADAAAADAAAAGALRETANHLHERGWACAVFEVAAAADDAAPASASSAAGAEGGVGRIRSGSGAGDAAASREGGKIAPGEVHRGEEGGSDARSGTTPSRRGAIAADDRRSGLRATDYELRPPTYDRLSWQRCFISA